MDRGAWQATFHGVMESDMIERLTHTHTPLCLEFKNFILECMPSFNIISLSLEYFFHLILQVILSFSLILF